MMGQTRERKWTSSGSAQPPRRLPSALKKPLPVDSDQARWARPPSAMRPPSTRPDSRRLNSRPTSRMDSRPDPLLDSRPHEISRPKSGVRPLSGKVFMRRTTDHGWVAKAYDPMPGAHSQPDLDLFDDISDCESLDSFFDDDFDIQTSEEKLGNLLSCNTLGVESKGRRPDWVAGKLGIPEFHCPRCRDHWYGLTDVPCDEELARLIREGLWHTGNEGGEKTRRGGRGGRGHLKTDKDRDYRSHSSITLSSKSSSTRLDQEGENGEKGRHRGSSQMNGAAKDSKKSKKRITFKLDNEQENSDSNPNSQTQLDGYGGYKRAQGSKKFGDGLSHGDGRQLEAGDLNSGGGYVGGRGVKSDSSDSHKAGEGSGESGGSRRRKGTVSEDGVESSGSGLLDGSFGGRKRAGNDHDSGNAARQLGSMGVGGTSGQDGTGKGKRDTAGSGVNGVHGYVDDDGSFIKTGTRGSRTASTLDQQADDTNLISIGPSGSVSSSHGSTEYGRNEDEKTRQKTGGKDHSNTSLNSSSQVRHTNSRRGSISTEDHGRNVRKPGGYMRAVSPSASEWGDPTHARPFISSTATSRTVSRCGSAVNLGRSVEDDENGRVSLPPIVPAISNKKPLLDLSDLMGGFQFTRAWTFSYHNNT